jgi:hypothetical protein
MPAVTQMDLKRKLAVYDSEEKSEEVATWLLRDFRRMAKMSALPAAA